MFHIIDTTTGEIMSGRAVPFNDIDFVLLALRWRGCSLHNLSIQSADNSEFNLSALEWLGA